WTGPAPEPVAPEVPLAEGDLTEFLINVSGPVALPRPAPGTPLPGPDTRFPVYVADFSGAMANIVFTLARINKYGEPEFGLRKRLLRVARFLADDLSAVPLSEAKKGGKAQQIGLISLTSRSVLVNFLRNAVKPDDRISDGMRKASELFWHMPRAVRPPPPKPGEQELALDDFDLASAALDIVLSTDDKGKQAGLLAVFGRPDKFNDTGAPIYAPDDPTPDPFYGLMLPAIIDLIGKRQSFGGSAAPNSPEDAVGCKGISTLATLGDVKQPKGAGLRRGMFNSFFIQLASFRGRNVNYASDPRFLVARTLVLTFGVGDDAEATVQANALFGEATYDAVLGLNDAMHAYDAATGARVVLATMRDFSTYSRGPGHAKLMQLLRQRFDDVQQRADDERKKWEAEHAANPMLSFSFHKVYWDHLQSYVDAWNAMQPDWSPTTIAELCKPEYGPPRVLLFAQGAGDPFILDKLYQNVPLKLGVVFPEAYDGDSYAVSLQTSGGRLDLTAKPVNEERVLFLTDPFVIPGQ
ncbi:MAG TPA: hypothetical protein VEC75_11195, partial [Stellaceae bacterium]|nr:hypothetical protein [Stellaceae bacterium]